jgi:hypothetical protein
MAELTAQGGLMKGTIALLLALGVLALSVLAAVATPSANAARGTTSGPPRSGFGVGEFLPIEAGGVRGHVRLSRSC